MKFQFYISCSCRFVTLVSFEVPYLSNRNLLITHAIKFWYLIIGGLFLEIKFIFSAQDIDFQ